MLKFPEMPYERPDIEAAKQFLAQAAARLEAAESFEAADAVFVEVNERSTQLDTMFTISHIRHDINTADEFYDAEVEYADTALPELQEYVDRWNRSEEYRAESKQMQVQFELNYVDESESPEYQGRFTVTNYYTVAFTADAAGEVAIDD